MSEKRLKFISVPCDLKAKVKRLARQNDMTCSDLIRLSIEVKLPDCEAGRSPTEIPMRDDLRRHKIDV